MKLVSCLNREVNQIFSLDWPELDLIRAE